MKRLLLVAVASIISFPSLAQEDAASEPSSAPKKSETTEETKEPSQEISDSASKYKCEHANMVRKIEIVSVDPQADPDGNACEVKYIKETEKPGEEQTLWTAKNDREYCTEKAAGLANKLEGWGWSCTTE